MFGGKKMNGEPPGAPQTSSMWADMLGIGPLLATIQDPAFQQQIRSLLQMVVETHQRVERIEQILMASAYVEPGGNSPIIPIRNNAAGTGTHTAATGALDDGGSAAAADRGAPGGQAGGARPGGGS